MLNFQIFISQIAAPIPMCITLFILAVVLFIFHSTKEFYKIFFTVTFAICFSYTLKYLFKIPRPTDMLVIENDYRFPSGHATMAAVIMSLGIYYAHLHIKNKILRYVLYTTAVLWYLLVSYSRLYLHVHYLVDVIAGGIIGVFSTILIVKIFKHLHYYNK